MSAKSVPRPTPAELTLFSVFAALTVVAFFLSLRTGIVALLLLAGLGAVINAMRLRRSQAIPSPQRRQSGPDG